MLCWSGALLSVAVTLNVIACYSLCCAPRQRALVWHEGASCVNVGLDHSPPQQHIDEHAETGRRYGVCGVWKFVCAKVTRRRLLPATSSGPATLACCGGGCTVWECLAPKSCPYAQALCPILPLKPKHGQLCQCVGWWLDRLVAHSAGQALTVTLLPWLHWCCVSVPC